MIPPEIVTARLRLVPATQERLRACLLAPAEFGRLCGWSVAQGWPAQHWDEGAVKWLLERLASDPASLMWNARFVLLDGAEGPSVIGTVGTYGPPGSDGVVEIGYGIVDSLHRRGYGSEAAAGLIGWVWKDPRVKVVCAHTLVGDPASSGVLRRCGFARIGVVNRPPDGEIERFELARP